MQWCVSANSGPGSRSETNDGGGAPRSAIPRYYVNGDVQEDGLGLLEVNPMDGSVFVQISALPSGYEVVAFQSSRQPLAVTP